MAVCWFTPLKFKKGLKAVAGLVSRSASRKPGCTDHTFREIYRFVPGITKTQFPVPCFKVITKFSHLAFKAGVKQHIVFGGGRCSVTLLPRNDI